MNAVERLRRDHKILRSKLEVLEGALEMKADTWFVLREVCFTLSRQLRDHIRREETLVAACRSQLKPEVLSSIKLEHHDEPNHLRAINRLFVSEGGHSLKQIRPALLEVIKGLRKHMDEEEKTMFPLLESLMEKPAAGTDGQVSVDGNVHEEMTVNRVLHQFPKTRPVFEHYFVNVPMEGCQCLDEVAWRHGMDGRDLVRALEGAIAACKCSEKNEPEPVLRAREI